MIVQKTALEVSTARRPTLFYESARAGMRDFLTNTLKSPDEGVLLPGYIGQSPREGSGVLDPVREVGVRRGFYDLRSDLTVNLDDLQRALAEQIYRVVVVIHYFGRSEPRIAEVRALADKYGALLVEDLAHGFFTAHVSGGAGKHGHVTLYSLHKMFPFADGGMVQYLCPELMTRQASSRPELAQRLLDYDWGGIAHTRRRVFLELTDRLASLPERGRDFELLWPSLAYNDVPQTLPVVVLGDGRDNIYFGMNADGYGVVSLYHTLIEECQGRFPELTTLSRHILNFPVHQDVQTGDLGGMIESFRRHLASEPRAAS
ncbi:aspartate aminotransferase family protein [Humibacter ginsengisoli]